MAGDYVHPALAYNHPICRFIRRDLPGSGSFGRVAATARTKQRSTGRHWHSLGTTRREARHGIDMPAPEDRARQLDEDVDGIIDQRARRRPSRGANRSSRSGAREVPDATWQPLVLAAGAAGAGAAGAGSTIGGGGGGGAPA